ncbi:putative metallocarboxypeptidase ecm14 [Rhizina undulata]
MHFLPAVLAAGLLLSAAEAASIPDSFAQRDHHAPASSLPPSFPPPLEIPDDRTWAVRLRDSVVGRVFSKSERSSIRRSQQKHLAQASSILSQYAGDVVLRFNLSSSEEAKALAEASNALFLDVWATTRTHADIRLSEAIVPSLLGLLPQSMQHSHTRLMHDLSQTARDTFPGAVKPHPTEDFKPVDLGTNNLFFQDYQPLSVIGPWMKLLESLFPYFVEVVTIGKSYEGRDIQGLRVGVPKLDGTKKKTIIVNGGSHAREWISVSTVSYLAYSLITGFGKHNEVISKLVREFDWIFIPTLNVDGYAYSWEHDRLWRKNRQPTSLSFCKGIDLDRAYNFHFDGSPQSMSNPCSDMFPGESAFEAAEAKTFMEWVANLSKETQIVGLLDFHSYSQQILYPYSYSCYNTPPDLENLEELGFGLAKAIRVESGEHYEVTSACDGGGFANAGGGSMIDYFYADYKIRYAYQIKLRDTGSYGFLLPKNNIIPTGEESLNLMKFFGNFIMDDESSLSKAELKKRK